MNLSMKQKRTQEHKEQTRGCQGGRGWGKGWSGRLGLEDISYYI